MGSSVHTEYLFAMRNPSANEDKVVKIKPKYNCK